MRGGRALKGATGAVALTAALAFTTVLTHAGPTTIEGSATATERAVRMRPADTPPGAGGDAPLPAHARPVDTSRPDRVIGNGTAASCTSAAVVAAVAAGGVITFDCGPGPVTIEMQQTAKVVNTSPLVVLDGGGLVTLSGGGERRILYQNTCDQAQVWTTPHCQNQDHPMLVVQGLHFTRGNSTGETLEGGGGGAIFVRGGQLKIVDSTFTANRCDAVGPDVGGAAVRALSQFDGRPVVVARSTFGGSPAEGNVCSNGGGTSSIGVSWEIYASRFTNNRAIGNGANPAQPGTPGGGNGGAIYLDGNEMTLRLVDTVVHDNTANEGGGAVFFVSNNGRGEMFITGSDLARNPSLGFETQGFPGVFFLGRGAPHVSDSTIR